MNKNNNCPINMHPKGILSLNLLGIALLIPAYAFSDIEKFKPIIIILSVFTLSLMITSIFIKILNLIIKIRIMRIYHLFSDFCQKYEIDEKEYIDFLNYIDVVIPQMSGFEINAIIRDDIVKLITEKYVKNNISSL